MVFRKRDVNKQKKAPARMLVTVVRSGDAPKPPFPIKINKKSKNPEIRIGGRRQRRQPVNWRREFHGSTFNKRTGSCLKKQLGGSKVWLEESSLAHLGGSIGAWRLRAMGVTA